MVALSAGGVGTELLAALTPGRTWGAGGRWGARSGGTWQGGWPLAQGMPGHPKSQHARGMPTRWLQIGFPRAPPQHPASSEHRPWGDPPLHRSHPPSRAVAFPPATPLPTASAAPGRIFPIQSHLLLSKSGRAFIFGVTSGQRSCSSQQPLLHGVCVPPGTPQPPAHGSSPAEPIRFCFPIAGNNLTLHI